MTKKELLSKTVKDLRETAISLKIDKNIQKLKKEELIDLILQNSNPEKPKPVKEIKNSTKKTEKLPSKIPNSSGLKVKPTSHSHSPKTKVKNHSEKSTAPTIAINLENNPISSQTEQKLLEPALDSLQNQTPKPQTPPQNQNERKEPQFRDESTVEVSGILEVMSDGTHGVLRSPRLIPSDKDTYISISQVKKFRLRKGDFITGIARLPKDNERYYSLLWIKDVNGLPVDKIQHRPNFDEMKPVYPDKQITLETGQYPISNRIIDLMAPVGFGQRGMIVAQPKSGKTFLLKDIAQGINKNYPEIKLIVVLIGERPEEVTDIERSVNGIVYASNFDDSPQNQVMVAELSLERAKRMVEMGEDVIILMDSLTRLARAYNVALPASGRTLSGGLDPISLYPSKRFFGAARNFEKGASLTIIATSLVDTGSKMDEVIFEEFKGTGNMELKLDRRLANKRVFPAIDLSESNTRNEELLLGSEKMQSSWRIRRLLESVGQDANEALIDRLKTTKSNEEFLQTLHQV